MKLEVGQFVRFKDKRGNEYIRKIVEIPEDNRYASLYLDKDANYSKGLSIKNVIKGSYNIIDILEEGDLVEIEFYSPRYETRVTRLFEVEFRNADSINFANVHCQLYILNGCWSNEDKKLKPIFKSIVTHGQLEQMTYKVEE